MRVLTYSQAISEALVQAMRRDRRVFIMGLGVDTPTGVFGTTIQASRKYPARVIGTPIAENTMTGVALGAAVAGMKPVLMHQRMDFMLMSMDQLVNHVAKWSFMTAGKSKPTVVVRAVIGHAVGGGWGQASQHAQSLEALFASVPGLRVVMPFTPSDAKGMLLEALDSEGPTVYLDHRLLHAARGHVPEKMFRVPFGKAVVRRRGTAITIAATSVMNRHVGEAARVCSRNGIDVEWIDLRCVKPWDRDSVLSSVRTTGRLLVVDTGHVSFGPGAEVVATISELAGSRLRAARRIGLPDLPVPAGPVMEKQYYPGVENILSAVADLCGVKLPARKISRTEARQHGGHVPAF
jgi:pyruvate dehydrogenase E1 component beta subunit